MLIVPVLVPFFQPKGLDLAEIFYLQAVYAAVIVLLEAPSGYFADVMGRRLALRDLVDTALLGQHGFVTGDVRGTVVYTKPYRGDCQSMQVRP